MRPPIERFMDKVEAVTESGCWIWTGGLNAQGYGQFHDNDCHLSASRGQVLAHRWSLDHFRGPIPKKAFVCHRCDVPSCVNPDHLWAGDHEQNMADLWRKGRGTRGRKFPEREKQACKYGHLFTPENTIYAGVHKAKRCRICTARRKAEDYRRSRIHSNY